ncbi:LuxR C-terminal-related transcriptional regulator [Eudoraea sp.]|uniref:LuxR C-terminal-related transcriptional regulator n=1 Tax=Eudoraea sp. TaxID=1979955 RepID=UPI003C73B494
MLRTKLHRPPLTAEHVLRSRLITRFEKNYYKPLSLVCAPAGYGKSMVVSSWLDNSNYKYVWISLSEDENDPKVFLNYLQTAIENIFPNSLSEFADLIQFAKLPPIELLVDTLINELDQITEDFVLVLDDYHLINDENIHSLLNTWLRYPPSRVHLVISTRRDPSLKLNTLRLRNRINEIRMNDLGFDQKEIVSLYEKSLNVKLEMPTITTLEKKTEGWVTALRLILLTYDDWKDNNSVLNNYIEDTLLLTEYLVEEVVKKQPQVLQNILLKLSILGRFCDQLIEVILQSEEPAKDKPVNGQETIIWLLKSDLFVITLDSEGKWFRFHHQFQHLLQKQLKQKYTVEDTNKLHIDVSNWLVKNEYFEEGFYHAQQANNDEIAARILIENRSTIMEKGLWDFRDKSMKKLPAQIIDKSPELLIIQSWVYYSLLNFQALALNLEKIEKLSEKISIDSVKGEIDFFMGLFCYFQANSTYGEKPLKNAIKNITPEFSHNLGEAELWYALTLHANNKEKEAITFLENKINDPSITSNIRLTRLYAGVDYIHLLDANLSMAVIPAVKVKEIGYENNYPFAESWGKYTEALVMFNQGEFLKGAKSFSELTQKTASLHSRLGADSFAAMMFYHQIKGKHAALEETIEKFRKYSSKIDNDPSVNLVLHSAQARLALLQGDLDAAIRFIRMADIATDEGLMLWWIEIPRITLCRVLIAEGTDEKINEAIIKLNVLYDDNDKVRNSYQKIGIKLLLAIAYHKLGEKEAAIKNLTACIEMGSPNDWIFPFIEYRETMLELLPLVLSGSKKHSRYINKLRKALEKNSEFRMRNPVIDIDKKDVTHTEHLSVREKEILLLVSEGLRNKEIAMKLFVSEGTIKKHVYNMGQKFETSSRVDLLNRTRQLELIK